MLNWAVTFFVVAIIAALLGLGSAGMSADIAWMLAVIGGGTRHRSDRTSDRRRPTVVP
jgi:hypothetical protein